MCPPKALSFITIKSKRRTATVVSLVVSVCLTTETDRCCKNGSSRNLWVVRLALTTLPLTASILMTTMDRPAGRVRGDNHNIQDCGLSVAEAAAVAEGWKENTAAVDKAVLAKGGFPYPYFVMSGRNETDPHESCQRARHAEDVRHQQDSWQAKPPQSGVVSRVLASLPHCALAPERYATLVPARSRNFPAGSRSVCVLFAWLGYTWSGCTDSGYPAGCDPACTQPGCKPCRFPTAMDSHPFPRPGALDSDFGEPVGQCHESSAGVWTREWSKASVELNCNSFRASMLKK